jgi:Acetyltransferases
MAIVYKPAARQKRHIVVEQFFFWGGIYSMIDVNVIEHIPSAEEFLNLRAAVGWRNPEIRAAEKGINNSLFMVCAESMGKIVGCGRIVGDNGYVFYIQDIIVLPEYQGRGIGAKIMDRIMDYLKKHAVEGAVVGLMAAKGKENFYKKYGFIERPTVNRGAGMIHPF